MSSCRSRGIVLNVIDHGEADKIVTLFSPELGKAAGIAKGAKRSRKRFVNKLEQFSLLQLIYRPARRDGLILLAEAELENAFLSIRTHYDRYVAAMYIGELTLRFTREHDPDPGIFALLLWALQALEEGYDPPAIATHFHLRLLGAAGYEPQLDRCGCCAEGVENDKRYGLLAGRGILACDRCQDEMRGGSLPLSVQTLRFLQHAQRTELKNLSRLRLTRKNALEALSLLHRYTQHLLQHDIHAWHQLRYLAMETPVGAPSGDTTQDGAHHC